VKEVGRNDPCPCGSGKKFKRCCRGKTDASLAFTREERQAALDALFHFGERAEFENEQTAAELSDEALEAGGGAFTQLNRRPRVR